MNSKILKGASVLLASSAALATFSLAAVPSELIYEGRMISKTGEVLTDSYVLRFSFWKSSDFVSSDLSGSDINTAAPNYAGWKEVLPISFNELGHFSVILGKTTSLSSLDFEKYKFLQVEIKKASEPDSAYKLMDIDGDNGANTTDRKTVASVPYAKHADEASVSNNANFTIDAANAVAETGTGSINLHFGGSLNKMLSYDLDAQRFVFNDNIEVKGDILVSGKVDGVDVSELGTNVANLSTSLQNLGSITGNTFIVDSDNTGGNITLQFGDTLKESLTWDDTNKRFDLSDDLNVDGNITLPGTVDGVDISDLKLVVDGNTSSIGALQTTVNTHSAELANQAAQIAGQAGNLTTLTQTLADHTALLSQNSTVHTDITNQILQLGTELTTQAWQITTLSNTLATHTSELSTLTTQVAGNSNALLTHTAQINTLTNTVTIQGAQLADLTNTVATHTAELLTLANQVNANTADISALQTATNANTLDIATLKTQVADQAVQLASHANQLATHTSQITDLTTKIATIENTLISHAADISSLQAKDVQLQSAIDANTASIMALQAKDVQLQSAIDANSASIVALQAKDAQLQSAIDANTASIVALQAKDAQLQSAIDANTASIAALQAKDAQLQSAIDANSASIMALQAKDILHSADIADLKAQVAQNISAIATNATKITNLEARVTQNEADIADLKTRMTAAEAKNTAQDAQLATITTLVGDGQYDSTNIISFGDSLTDAISKIDAFLGTAKALSLHIPLSAAVMAPDGTNNKVNVYYATEGGVNPHQFLKVVSSKTALQDMTMQFKIQLPKDLKKLTSFKLFYKSEGTAAQNSFDITLKDSAGIAAFTDSNLSNTAWTPLVKTIGSTFAPVAGDFVYVTITARSVSSKAMLIGDLVLEYESNR